MWIRDVDVPAALIEAHRAQKMVIFVGAGASRDAPASLPIFTGLTAAVADDVGVAVTPEELNRPDVVLGQLADQGNDVHGLVAARIGVSTSEPNRLHKALIDLAVAEGPLRIVTTNYDRHLSTVLIAQGVGFEEYTAPALPMGDDFTGIVYLHGSLRQEPRHLVMTDSDFGRAYLRDAWAARFLERMFGAFTVLFVGYSHGDIVMQYLARSLGPGAARYVLTPTPSGTDWHALGLHPIEYTVTGGSHSALADTVEGWAQYASMGLLDHRTRIAQLVSAPPSQIPAEESYLEATLAHPDQARLFVDLARGQEWLLWAAGRPEFRVMFEPYTVPTPHTFTLASWFAEHFVMIEDLTGTAMSVVWGAGGALGRAVWESIALRLHSLQSPRPAWLGPWIVLLIQNAPERDHDLLDYALVASLWPLDSQAALLLFDHLTEPHTRAQRAFIEPRNIRFEIQLRGSQHWLDQAWRDLFFPNLRQAAPAVIAIADRHLRRAFQLLASSNSAGPDWDPVSYGRSAIIPHEQDQYREPIDVLIDAARDCMEALLDVGDSHAFVLANTWADSDAPILRRLAVHTWTERKDVDGTAKITWLRQRGWLFDVQLRHETYRLISVALPSAAQEVADGLVNDAVAGPRWNADPDQLAYQIFNALAWMSQHAPNLRSAADELERMQAQHPEFAVREHPDLLHYMQSGFVQHQSPMTTQDLHEQIDANPTDAVAGLLQYEDIGFDTAGPDWDDAQRVLRETVQIYPADGFAVLNAGGQNHPGIADAVIFGWQSADMDDNTARAIVEQLNQQDLSIVTSAVSQLLAGFGRGDTESFTWHRLPEARTLAADLWQVVAPELILPNVDDWVTIAINTAAGRIAQFWVGTVATGWKAAGDDWTGLPVETQSQLNALLTTNDSRSAMAEVIFAGNALFFFSADQAWSETNVLPLLNWVNPQQAMRAWQGYLTWGRWNTQLLDAGLRDGYLATVGHISEFRSDLRRQLLVHLASLAIFSESEPFDWLRKLTRDAEVADLATWMDLITRTLSDLPPETVEHQWHRWMHRYWKDRVASIPRQLTPDEASAMACWVVFLTDSLQEGIALATAHTAGFHEHSDILDELTESRVGTAPAEFAMLIAHLLRGTQRPLWGVDRYIKPILPILRAGATPEVIATIVEEALRLGYPDAPQW